MRRVLAQILHDEIDILLTWQDIRPATGLPLFCAKAAPIQATYLGYYGTTGLPQVDYWVTDSVLHPPESEKYDPCSEERWRLDRCYVSFRPLQTAHPSTGPPCLEQDNHIWQFQSEPQNYTWHSITLDGCTQCCFPNSKAAVKSKNLGKKLNVDGSRPFPTNGISKNDLSFVDTAPVLKSILLHTTMLILLWTLSLTGCTTTADALWMGVPVLTIAGSSMVSRQAAAVLKGVGLERWICRDGMEMVEQALILSQ